jgi:hypothetical protein
MRSATVSADVALVVGHGGRYAIFGSAPASDLLAEVPTLIARRPGPTEDPGGRQMAAAQQGGKFVVVLPELNHSEHAS